MNLFERLYRYREKASKHERENYLTELLATILERNPSLITILCTDAGINLPSRSVYTIRTQQSYAEGRPDIVIETAAHEVLLLIECKLEAGEGHEQLANYQRILAASSAAQKGIIFLTKYYEAPRAKPVVCLRWYQLFQRLSKLPDSELLSLFREYLIFHRLHQPMSFQSADLLALEQIQATITKMDEILTPIEWEFRRYIGGTYQYTKTRCPRFEEGWYGYWRFAGSATFSAGFLCGAGEMPRCFVEVKTWSGSPEPVFEGEKRNTFQQAVRKTWNLPDSKLNDLVIAKSVTAFMTTSGQDEGVIAMREWFQARFQELNQLLEQHSYFLQGVSPVPPELAAEE
ncbi:PD-(D/E)XK nuclease family protein, partial [Hymenobacter defluvii]